MLQGEESWFAEGLRWDQQMQRVFLELFLPGQSAALDLMRRFKSYLRFESVMQ
jgi:hypothetical protein